MDTLRHGENGAKSSHVVPNIIVSQSAFSSDDPTQIVAQNVDFVNAMFQRGAYERDEIPRSAMLSYHVDYYLAQVSNGGHGQFVGNSGWQPLPIEDCAEGLKLMEASPYTEIFSDLRKLIDGDPVRASVIADGRGFGEKDPAIAELDNRYYAQDAYKVITPANAKWLRSLPELQVVADADYASAIEAVCATNLQREARLADRRSRLLQARLEDPLWVAARMACFKAGRLPVLSIPAGDPAAIAPDGRQETGWGVNTPHGNHTLFIFDDSVLLCDRFLADGRQITPQLTRDMNARMADGNFNLSAWAKIEHKEVAKVETTDVRDAVAAAKELGIAAAAQRACSNLEPPDHVEDIWAVTKSNQGQWIWQVLAKRSVYYLGFRQDEPILFDAQMKPLPGASRDTLTADSGFRPLRSWPDDGPTEMPLARLLLGLNGRIDRGSYWLASLAVAAVASIYIAFMFGPRVLFEGSKAIPKESLSLAAVAPLAPLLWMQVALASKRLHDLGHPARQYFGLLLMLAVAAPLLAGALGRALRLGTLATQWQLVAAVVGYVYFTIASLWLAIKMLFFKSQVGANKYGARALQPRWHQIF